MSEAQRFDPYEVQKEVAHIDGRLFLVPEDQSPEMPESEVFDNTLDPVYKKAAEQHLPEAKAILDPAGELAAQKAKKLESARIDAEKRQAPPPSLN